MFFTNYKKVCPFHMVLRPVPRFTVHYAYMDNTTYTSLHRFQTSTNSKLLPPLPTHWLHGFINMGHLREGDTLVKRRSGPLYACVRACQGPLGFSTRSSRAGAVSLRENGPGILNHTIYSKSKRCQKYGKMFWIVLLPSHFILIL